MKTFTQKELDAIIKKHKLWVYGEEGGERADLWGADLQGANLQGANLQGATLWGADLQGANLQGATLWGADLQGATLWGADLQGANLQGATLRGAYLRGANLQEAILQEAILQRADLQGANLQGAILWGADLQRAYLQEAILQGANLQEADLWGAHLRGANLQEAKGIPSIACPEEGSFIAFKKVRDDKIVKLLIPEDAKRCSATSRKCRCDKAIVLSITNLDGSDSEYTSMNSQHDANFFYEVGKMVSVSDFEEDRWKECAPGIHFFITRQEAVDY